MKNPRAIVCALGALLLATASTPAVLAALPAAAGGQPLPSLAPMLERITPAVVNVATRSTVLVRESPLLADPFFRRFFDLRGRPRARKTQSLGSGVIVDAQRGFVLTNHHVIDKAQEITVTLRDGRKLAAELVGADPDTDVAVIRIPPGNLTAVQLADSDSLRVGDFVVAIGNPFGLGQTVTSGIVSALGRSGLGIEGYEDFIQTDASINVGNSGGALVNLRGELVGINTAILAPGGGNVGIGFAIPVNMARSIMNQLFSFGEVRRGLLGVATQDLTPPLAEALGVPVTDGAVVVEVKEASPADVAGIVAGDVITAIAGRPVRRTGDVRNAIGLLAIDAPVTVEVLRSGEKLQLTATLVDRREVVFEAQSVDERLQGASLADILPDSPLHGRIEGVRVVEVAERSPGWRVGLRSGDVIVGANRVRVRTLEELREIVRRGGRALTLNVRRGSGSLFILVR
jgi:serine protease Do/serine protease DegQ